MKKVIIAILLVILTVFCLSGCTYAKTESVGKNTTSMFVIIEETVTYKIVYHKETLVMYAVSTGTYNNGTFTLLVNADGSPMLYEER